MMTTSAFAPWLGLLLCGASAASCWYSPSGGNSQRRMWLLGLLLWITALICWHQNVNLLAAVCITTALWMTACLLLLFLMPLVRQPPDTSGNH